MKAFRGLSVATAVVTYALVVLGGVVRVSGSGLGCPDWPLCHGRVLPPLDLHAIIEYSHRTTASLTSGLVLVTAAFAWVAWRRRRDIVIPATVALGLLVVQVVLGAVCITAVAAIVAPPGAGADRPSVGWSRAAAAGTYTLILSGSLVVGSAASGSCNAWPLCGGGFSFAFDGLPAIQLVHRGIAALVGVL